MEQTVHTIGEEVETLGLGILGLCKTFDRSVARVLPQWAMDRFNAIPNVEHLDTIAAAIRDLGDEICREADAAAEAA